MYTRTNDYANQRINGQMHIWLQQVGFCPAKVATDFKVGDFVAYNCGYVAEVTAIEEKSKCFLTFTVKSEDGKLYKQNVKKTAYKPYRSKG